MEATLSAARERLAMLGTGVALGLALTFGVAGYHGTTVGSTPSVASSQASPDNIRMPYSESNLLLHAGCGAVRPELSRRPRGDAAPHLAANYT